jgi:hypothetical protein
MEGKKAMNTERLRYEMDADEWAEHEGWIQARREMDRD